MGSASHVKVCIVDLRRTILARMCDSLGGELTFRKSLVLQKRLFASQLIDAKVQQNVANNNFRPNPIDATWTLLTTLKRFITSILVNVTRRWIFESKYIADLMREHRRKSISWWKGNIHLQHYLSNANINYRRNKILFVSFFYHRK